MTCTKECITPSVAQAHCGACHRTFGGVRGFDAHRARESVVAGMMADANGCLDPATCRPPMQPDARGIWRRVDYSGPAHT